MKISYLNQLITQLYDNTEIDNKSLESLQIDNNITSTILNLKNPSIDEKSLDTIDTIPIITAALNMEPTEENLAYIQRLGFSLGINLERLISLINKDDIKYFMQELNKVSISPDEIQTLMQDMTIEDLLNISNILDKIIAMIRYDNGEYINISTRLSANIYDDNISFESHMEQILNILQELDMDINPENIEIVDKFIFVFKEEIFDFMHVLKSQNENNSTINLKNIIEEPTTFLAFYKTTHNINKTMSDRDIQYIYNKANNIIECIDRYVRLFPVEIRKDIYAIFRKILLKPQYMNILFPKVNTHFEGKLINFFETKLKHFEDNNVKLTLYSRIESDIAECLSLQIKDDFPFWLIPIFTSYGENLLFGEVWINKVLPKHNQKKLPYNLFLWSEFSNIGRIELFIHGVDKNINVYILCSNDTVDLIKKHDDKIIGILKSYGFVVNYFNLANLKDRNTIYRYLFTISIARGTLDIKI